LHFYLFSCISYLAQFIETKKINIVQNFNAADPKTIEVSDAPKSMIHSTMAPTQAKLAPLKKIHPRKLQKVG
jgi:hypothetical protein